MVVNSFEDLKKFVVVYQGSSSAEEAAQRMGWKNGVGGWDKLRVAAHKQSLKVHGIILKSMRRPKLTEDDVSELVDLAKKGGGQS